MQKTNKALLLYLQLDMQTLLTLYKDSIPSKYEQDTYFPTIDMLDFVLVRLQGACKLLIRIRDSARTAALYLGDKLIIGHFWKVTLLCLGIVSRLAHVGNEICRCFSNLYDKLLKCRSHFKNAGEKWLPDNYPFPVSMQTWLDVEFDVTYTDNLLIYDLSLAESVKAYNNISSIAIDSGSDTDEVELVDEYFDLDDNHTSKKSINSNENLKWHSTINSIDKNARIDTTGAIFVLDSDEDYSNGIEIDKFGNEISNGLSEFTKINKAMPQQSIKDMQIDGTFDLLTEPVSTNKGGWLKQNVAMENILSKIFQNQNSTFKKVQQAATFKPSKKQLKATKQLSKTNAKKPEYVTKNKNLNLNSKQAFYEFLNEQQRLLKKGISSCAFSQLNNHQFVNVRRQIHYILQTGSLPNEDLYQRCREIIYENINKGDHRSTE